MRSLMHRTMFVAAAVTAASLVICAGCGEDSDVDAPAEVEVVAPDGWTSETRTIKVATPEGIQSKRITYYKNSISMEFVWIPLGELMMGSPDDEEGRLDDEQQHLVILTKGFHMATTEVTQAQWQAVMGTTIRQQRDKANTEWPLRGEGENYPMYYVSWEGAVEFCRRLSQREGRNYRLPREAEWEYACRAGTTTPFHFGNTISTDQANYDGNHVYAGARIGEYRRQTTHVGTFPPNVFGLYDMHGNVCEWCVDWYGDYPSGKVTDPKGPTTGTERVLRGGSWYNDPRYCRSAGRGRDAPAYRRDDRGFRVGLDLK